MSISHDDLDECWCCGGLHDSVGTLCPSCSDAGCNRFTDECDSDHKPVLPDGGQPAEGGQQERRMKCSCGWQTGWFDPEDAEELAKKHLRREHQQSLSEAGGDMLQFKEREKTGQNYSDTLVDLGPPNECDNCGADNVQGQVMCAVCGGMVTDV